MLIILRLAPDFPKLVLTTVNGVVLVGGLARVSATPHLLVFSLKAVMARVLLLFLVLIVVVLLLVIPKPKPHGL